MAVEILDDLPEKFYPFDTGALAIVETLPDKFYPFPNLPVNYVNLVYDTGLSRWVWWRAPIPDTQGLYYGQDTSNWLSGSFSWYLRTILV